MSLAGQAKVKISNNYTSIIPVHKNRAKCNTVNFGSTFISLLVEPLPKNNDKIPYDNDKITTRKV